MGGGWDGVFLLFLTLWKTLLTHRLSQERSKQNLDFEQLFIYLNKEQALTVFNSRNKLNGSIVTINQKIHIATDNK